MRALAFLLGARALDAADAATPTRAIPEPALPPLATLPEGAAAWRRWAEAGRTVESDPGNGAPQSVRRTAGSGIVRRAPASNQTG